MTILPDIIIEMKLTLSRKSLWLILKWSLYAGGLLHLLLSRRLKLSFYFVLFSAYCSYFPPMISDTLQVRRMLWHYYMPRGRLIMVHSLHRTVLRWVAQVTALFHVFSFPKSWQAIKRWREKRGFGFCISFPSSPTGNK